MYEMIVPALERCEREVFSVLDVPAVDLVVSPGLKVIPEIGMTGYSQGAHQAFVAVNPANGNLCQEFEINFLGTVGHELHHCARTAKGKRGRSLWDTLIFEGLACHYESELRGSPPFYATFLFDMEQQRLLARVAAERDRKDFNYQAWFLGSEEENLSRYAGYSIGYSIVDRYIRKTGVPASKLLNAASDDFL